MCNFDSGEFRMFLKMIMSSYFRWVAEYWFVSTPGLEPFFSSKTHVALEIKSFQINMDVKVTKFTCTVGDMLLYFTRTYYFSFGFDRVTCRAVMIQDRSNSHCQIVFFFLTETVQMRTAATVSKLLQRLADQKIISTYGWWEKCKWTTLGRSYQKMPENTCTFKSLRHQGSNLLRWCSHSKKKPWMVSSLLWKTPFTTITWEDLWQWVRIKLPFCKLYQT